MKKISGLMIFAGLLGVLTGCTQTANMSPKKVTDDFLPIGTIVQVKERGKMMIAGIGQLSNDNYLYDYIGYPYPEGYTGNNAYLFGKDDITEIVYNGYETKESLEYGQDIEKKMEDFLK